MSRRRHSSWMGPIIELPRIGSVRIDHLRIDNVDGRTVVSAVIRAGERESSAVIYESTDASEAIQWAIDNYPQIEIRGTHNISSPITIQSNTRITGEGGELRRTSRMLEGEDEPIIRIPIRERVTGVTLLATEYAQEGGEGFGLPPLLGEEKEEPKKPEPPEDVRDARVKGLINAIGKEEKKGKKKS